MTLPQPCRSCGKPGKALCDPCKALREAVRPSRQSRGYDTTYDQNRRQIVSQVLLDPAVPCSLCGRSFVGYQPHEITAEHRIPLRYGGSSDMANLAPAHARCNYGWKRKRRHNLTRYSKKPPALLGAGVFFLPVALVALVYRARRLAARRFD